jgi:prepilin-type N-terminal cleavage/methylation domain-containing protein
MRQQGFTLIELMVVVVIVTILAVMAAPAYRDMIDRSRLRGAADDVLSVLSNARAGAVKAGLDTDISVSTGTNWCVGATSATVPTGGAQATGPAACTCSNAGTCLVAGEQMAVPVGKHAGVTMASGAGFIYDAKLGTVLTGGAVAAAATPIVLTSPSGTYDVRVGVSPLGQATLCTPNGKPAMAGVSPCP